VKNLFEIILITLLLLIAAITAASEIALIAVSRLRLRRLVSDGSKTAKIILKILETPEKFFGTILVANNVVNTLLASIMTAITISIIGEESKGVLIATLVTTFLIIIFEVVAKTLAARHSEKLSLVLARPVRSLIDVLSPIVKVLAVVTNFIIGLIGIKSKGKASLVGEEELRALIKIGEEENVLHKEKYRMLSKVFDFSETIVRNVMTPKKGILSININSSLEDILDKVLESGYSRLPVYKDNQDNIIGIVNMKDLLNLAVNKELVVLQDIIYPPISIPGTKKVTELLKEFQKGHAHLAIVVDQNGKIEGLVTLEDLLEEIVGEIEDEYDVRSSLMGKSI